MRWLAVLLRRAPARPRESRWRTRLRVRHRPAGLAVVAAALLLLSSLGAGIEMPPVIVLHPTGAIPSARGTAQLAPTSTPFAAAVTRDSHVIYDATVRAEALLVNGESHYHPEAKNGEVVRFYPPNVPSISMRG